VPRVTYVVDGVLVAIINDHRKLHCPLTFFPQNIFNPYKKGTGKSNTMAKGIRGAQSIKQGKRSCHIILQKNSVTIFFMGILFGNSN
jgi:hypothetical protein